MKRDFGRKIHELMARVGIKTAKELADRINEEAGERIVSPGSVGKWLAGKTVPKSTSLMFLAKALQVRADLILYGVGDQQNSPEDLREVVASIIQEETRKLLKESEAELREELRLLLRSKKVPEEDKRALLRQVRNLLKLYEEIPDEQSGEKRTKTNG